MAFLSVVGLTACSGDEPKDSVKEIRMQVSAETGVMYAWGDDKKENPIECMLANPPADGSDRTYSLIRILQDRLVTEPEIPVDEEITSPHYTIHAVRRGSPFYLQVICRRRGASLCKLMQKKCTVSLFFEQITVHLNCFSM